WIEQTEEHLTVDGLRNSSAWIVPAGAVLVAMYGATAGAVGFAGNPVATNQAVLALIGKPDLVDQRFLFHWLRSRTAHLKTRATGAAQPNLSKARVLEEAFPSAPINEQQQIAKTLDSVLDAAIKYAELARALETVRREVLHELV